MSQSANTHPPGATPRRSIWRVIFGRRLKTSEGGEQKVGALPGVPILGLDALGSASYGPEAALTILLPAGVAGLYYFPALIGAILLLLCMLYLSYRQTIAAYPNGGGAYTVARENLGKRAGLVAAASLLLDYVLNVAVGVSAGVGALESAVPSLQPYTLVMCLTVLALITLVNLRGVRESGLAWSIPTFVFVAGLLLVVVVGIARVVAGGGHPAPVVAPPAIPAATASLSFWLLLRAFASGCTAMTGVEAVSNGVPLFRDPAEQNAKRTLTIICAVLGVLLGGLGYLARAYHIGALSQESPGYQSVVSQLTAAVLGKGWLYYVVIGSVLMVLTLSANTSFAGFPRLCRLLAEDRYLPWRFCEPWTQARLYHGHPYSGSALDGAAGYLSRGDGCAYPAVCRGSVWRVYPFAGGNDRPLAAPKRAGRATFSGDQCRGHADDGLRTSDHHCGEIHGRGVDYRAAHPGAGAALFPHPQALCAGDS